MFLSIYNSTATPWELPAILPLSNSPRGYPACRSIEITTMGLQDSIAHKDMGFFFTYFFLFNCRLLKITVSKECIQAPGREDEEDLLGLALREALC